MKTVIRIAMVALALVSIALMPGCRKDDNTPPVITITGDNPMTVYLGTSYTELLATATDNEDGTVSVSVIGSVDVNTARNYIITYSAEDEAGNGTAANRVVRVKVNRANYIWTSYLATDTCETNGSLGPFAYGGTISAGSGADSIIISNFRSFGDCYATIIADAVTIPSQVIGPYTFAGTGIMNNKANTLTLNYSDGTDTFEAVLTKQ